MNYSYNKKRKRFDIRSITFNKAIFVLYIAFMIVSVLFFIFGAFAGSTATSTSFNGGSSQAFDTDWISDSTGETIDTSHLGLVSDLEVMTPYRVSAELPVSTGEYALVFRSENALVDVYIDGKLISIANDPSTSFFGSGTASTWNYISLEKEYSEKKITLEITVKYDDYSCSLTDFSIGEGYAIVRDIMAHDTGMIVVVSFCIIIGVVFMLMTALTKKNVGKNFGTMYFGLFCICIGFWLFTQTVWITLLIKNAGFLQLIQNVLLMLSIIPIIMYIITAYEIEHKIALNVILIVCSVATVISFVYHFAGIADFHQTKFVYHGIIIVSAITIIINTLSHLIKNKGHGNISPVYYLGLMFFVITIIVDIIRYYGAHSPDVSLFTRCGLFILIISVGTSTMTQFTSLMSMGVRAISINKVAYTDALSGLENTAAFKRRMRELEDCKENYNYICIVQFDVNNLKTINDGMGHEAGDALIVSAADVIKQAFGSCGNCYRVGGDEFVVIITNEHAPVVYDGAAEKFEDLIADFNENKDRLFDLRIAYGVAFYQSGKTDMLLTDVHKLADERMYKNKVAMKQKYAKTPEEAIVR